MYSSTYVKFLSLRTARCRWKAITFFVACSEFPMHLPKVQAMDPSPDTVSATSVKRLRQYRRCSLFATCHPTGPSFESYGPSFRTCSRSVTIIRMCGNPFVIENCTLAEADVRRRKFNKFMPPSGSATPSSVRRDLYRSSGCL